MNVKQTNIKVDLNAQMTNGASALSLAVFGGKLDFVKALVDGGADLNIVDKQGKKKTNKHE